MKKKMLHNQLDERQEKALLKIEHYTCWLGFFGLVLITVIQQSFGLSLGRVGGEILIVFAMGLTLLIGCISQGIWDRYLPMTPKTNILAALTAALIVLGIHVLANLTGRGFALPWFFLLIIFVLTFVITFALLSFCAFLTKKRQEKLEEE